MTDNKSDPVNHPSHYSDSCSIECIDSMIAVLGLGGLVSFCMGNAYKYIWRYKYKAKPKEDLAKAKWYIDKAYCLDNGRHTDQIIGLRELYSACIQDLESREKDNVPVPKCDKTYSDPANRGYHPAPVINVNVDDLM